MIKEMVMLRYMPFLFLHKHILISASTVYGSLPVLLASLYVIYEERLNAKFVQIAIGTDDVYKSAEAIRISGGKITLEPGPLPGINTKITACLDPDGWKSV